MNKINRRKLNSLPCRSPAQWGQSCQEVLCKTVTKLNFISLRKIQDSSQSSHKLHPGRSLCSIACFLPQLSCRSLPGGRVNHSCFSVSLTHTEANVHMNTQTLAQTFVTHKHTSHTKSLHRHLGLPTIAHVGKRLGRWKHFLFNNK